MKGKGQLWRGELFDFFLKISTNEKALPHACISSVNNHRKNSQKKLTPRLAPYPSSKISDSGGLIPRCNHVNTLRWEIKPFSPVKYFCIFSIIIGNFLICGIYKVVAIFIYTAVSDTHKLLH